MAMRGRHIPRGDTRIVYGVRCVWWDSIYEASGKTMPGGGVLPCCPHCGSVLMEVPSLKDWNRNVDEWEAAGHPGYRAMMDWARGKCFPSMTAMKASYDARPIEAA